MAKIRVGVDERYPTFVISPFPSDREIELTDKEMAMVLSAEIDYEVAQAILEKAYNLAK